MKQSTPFIGVIGAGRWGKNIVKTLSALGYLGAVAEADANLNKAIRESYPSTKVYNSHTELLSDENISAVAIATPVNTHFAIAEQAIRAKKDLFIEKPITISSEEANKLIKLAKEHGSILMVGHMLLYQPAIQFLKTFLSAGDLGRVYSLRQVRRNLGTIRTHENVLYSLGVHDLAVLDYLIGESASKTTAVGQSVTTPGIEDDITVHLQYPSGIQAHLHVNWLWPIKDRHLMILGERGALIYNELDQTITLHPCHGNPDASITQGNPQIVFQGTAEPLVLEMQHFIDCIVGRKNPMSDGKQGYEIVKLMENINKQLNQTRNISTFENECA